MKLEIETYKSLCELKVFKINDIEACREDFGEQKDLGCEDQGEYECGNMQFIPYEPNVSVMEKYGINEVEYQEICAKLDWLSFGRCDLCV